MKERNYGIDLLRLVLMYMVCILHVLGKGGVLKACVPVGGGYKVFWLMEVISFCAVDGFALISGYMAKDRPQKYSKLVGMWFQVFFYSFIVTVILKAVGINYDLSLKGMIKLALPVTFGVFWYFTAYFALFFAMPVLNRFIFSSDEVDSKKAFIVLIVLFSFVGIVTDPFKTSWGYSALWLMVLYCMGALAKRIKLFEKRKTGFLILLWAVCILCSWGVKVFIGTGRLVNYISPTILISGIIMVVLFSRLKLNGKIISKLSPLAFGIYLFQLNTVIWQNVINGAFAFIAEKNLIMGVGYVFLLAFCIFTAGIIVEFVRSKLASALRIPLLSDFIVKTADKIMTKYLSFLK